MSARGLAKRWPVILGIAVLVGCANPTYVDKSDPDASSTLALTKVLFQVHDAYRADPPHCVAILPFNSRGEKGTKPTAITFDQKEAVRRALYAHIAPQGKHDVEQPRVDFVLTKLAAGSRADLGRIGEGLNCDALIVGEVTEYGSTFLGIYSRVAVGAKATMMRASDGAVLWEGEHVAASHGGSLPLSPIGLAMGVISAASNLAEEQLLRVIDDLARRLATTIPDNFVIAMDEPINRIQQVSAPPPEPPTGVDAFLSSTAAMPDEERAQLITQTIRADKFGTAATGKLYDALIGASPNDPGTHRSFALHLMGQGDYEGALAAAQTSLALAPDQGDMEFLTGRTHIKLGNLDDADDAIIRAIGLDETSAAYFRGLGYVNSLRDNHARASAAYRKALALDPTSGWANYNLGVTFFNLGDAETAGTYFFAAGKAYLASGDYGEAEKSLADLKGLAGEGLNFAAEVDTLETAIKALSKPGEKDG